MKEIKEEIKREVTDIHTYYEALDGTRFTSEEECKKYEDTALCVAKAKISKLIVTEKLNAWEAMGGYEDNDVIGVKVPTKEDADAIKQWLILSWSYLREESYNKLREDRFNKIDSAVGDLLLMGVNGDDEWYIINSRKNIIDNLTNLDKKKDA